MRLTLSHNGATRNLLFDMGILDHIEQITGDDPLNFSFEINKHQSLKYGLQTLIHAAMLNEYQERGAAPDFTAEDVDRLWRSQTMKELIPVINAWGQVKGLEASGEGGADTREEAAKVV